MPATRIKVAGARVAELDRFDEAELHVETTTIMFADVVESVRLIEQDEAGSVRRIRKLLILLATWEAPQCRGRVLERRGDGLLLSFQRPRDALKFAQAAHHAAELTQGETEEPLWLRIGIHAGRVLTDDVAIYGKSINFAARIASLANPGETTASADARDDLVDEIDTKVFDLGDCFLKHVAEPIRAFRLESIDSTDCGQSGRVLKAPTESSLRPTLTVFPLVESSGNRRGGNFGFCDIFAERLATLLSGSSSLNIVSSLSVLNLRGREEPAATVAKSLGADYFCCGSVVRSGDAFVAQISLNQTDKSQSLWCSEIRGNEIDVLVAESELLGQIAAAISDQVVSLASRLTAVQRLPNVASHALYLSAVSTMHRFSHRDFCRALPMLEALRERAPRHPDLLAWIARWHVLRVVQGWSESPKFDTSAALSFSDQALSRDDNCALALTVRGSAEIGVLGDVAAARALYGRALEINPNESLAWLLKSVADGIAGERADARNSATRAALLAPLHPYGFYYDSLRSTAALFARDLEQAAMLADRSIRLNCMHGSAYRSLAISLALQGKQSEAESTVAKLLAVEPACTLDDVRRRYGNQADANADFIDALRRAGLPESRAHVVFSSIGVKK
ncbi:MAG: adenylate/guanylate cyclase domain-containing protein [Casimicrobium sp.]